MRSIRRLQESIDKAEDAKAKVDIYTFAVADLRQRIERLSDTIKTEKLTLNVRLQLTGTRAQFRQDLKKALQDLGDAQREVEKETGKRASEEKTREDESAARIAAARAKARSQEVDFGEQILSGLRRETMLGAATVGSSQG